MPIAIVIRDLGFGIAVCHCGAQLLWNRLNSKLFFMGRQTSPQSWHRLIHPRFSRASAPRRWPIPVCNENNLYPTLYIPTLYMDLDKGIRVIFLIKKKNSGKYCALLTANLHSVTLIFILFFANQTYKITTVLLLSCKCTHFKYINFITYIFSTSVRNY